MASESSEDDRLRVSLPADLGTWLDEQARELDVERDRLLVAVLAAYRATAELDGDVDTAGHDVALAGGDAQEEAIATLIDERVEAALADRFQTTPTAVHEALDERVSALEDDVETMIQDVRDRVVQVKREADAKAPADHSHDALTRVDDLAGRLATVESDVTALAADLEEAEGESPGADRSTLDARVDEIADRLKTVAWVVKDLREAHEDGGDTAAVDRIKRAAAELDVARAKCEHCGEGVEIALLTAPTCPHCEATVATVEAASGFFGKPTLVVAAQLESGE